MTLVPRKSAGDVTTVEPLLDCVKKQLLSLVTTESEASDERSTMVLVRRHIFSKILLVDKGQGGVSASTPSTVGRGIRLATYLKPP